jgi:serralysin
VHGTNFADTLIGNGERNFLIGDDGDDTLSGLGGNDTLRGSAGADTLDGGDGVDWLQYYGSSVGVSVDLRADVLGVQAASGGDAQGDVISGFEHVRGTNLADTLIGNGESNVLIGDNGDDNLSGLGGNDWLRGGAGADTLDGGDGMDAFIFDRALGAGNIDDIVDFSVADDVIRLNNSVFAGLTNGVLAATAFRANATGLAVDAADRILYNTTTGQLSYDADGSESDAAVEFAVLQNLATLDASDFFVF